MPSGEDRGCQAEKDQKEDDQQTRVSRDLDATN
jgi:hypothetical protein